MASIVSSHETKSKKEGKSALPPHTLRLLKLVLEGTAEYADRASVHLKGVASTSSPTQLWEILGRLLEGLFSPRWKTRSQSADALQIVAELLPKNDKVSFMLEVRQNSHRYIRLDDLLTASTLQHIISDADPLFTKSMDGYDLYEETLDSFDRKSGAGLAEPATLQARMDLQRQLLAQRLGMGKIFEIAGSTGDILEEMESSIRVPSSTLQRKSRPSKRQKLSSKRGEEPEWTLSALLVAQAMTIDDKSQTAASHRNPQELLATELVYRMFHATWYERHGAILGLLSLVRAWRKILVDHPVNLGCWMEDVLARCLCIVALDRFGDFSGTMASTYQSSTGSVIAPVREVAGQLVSLLYQFSPFNERRKIHEILFRLAKQNVEWEQRHGALACFKYVLVVAKTETLWSSSTAVEQDLKRISELGVELLDDKSDDVSSAAAMLLLERLRGEDELPTEICSSAAHIVASVQSTPDIAASLIDLMTVLGEIFRMGALSFFEVLDSGWLINVAEMLCSRLDAAFVSIKRVALRAIQELVIVYERHIRESRPCADQLVHTWCRIIHKLARMIREMDGDATGVDEESVEFLLGDLLCAWKNLVSIPCLLGTERAHEVEGLARELLMCQYWDFLFEQPSGGLPLNSCESLGVFLLSMQRMPTRLVVTALVLGLHSPWSLSVETTCLLYRSVHKSLPSSDHRRIQALLFQLLTEKRPACLCPSFQSVERKQLNDSQVLSTSKEAFSRALGEEAETGSLDQTLDRFVILWRAALRSRGLHIEENFSCEATIATMRVESLIAGCLVLTEFPPKLTPIIRPLMTSVVNECCFDKHCPLVCADVVLLLNKLGQTNQLNPRNKLLNKICVRAIEENGSKSSEKRGEVAQRVVRLYVSELRTSSALMETPMWKLMIGSINSLDPSGKKAGYSLTSVVCQGLQQNSGVASFVVKSLARHVARDACVSKCLENSSSSILVPMATLDAVTLFQTIIMDVLCILRDSAAAQNRLRAIRLLRSVLENASTDIGRFVRVLLPHVMKSMTDPDEDCAAVAASLFSTLVLNAPFAQKSASISHDDCGLQPTNETVIDHLVFGLKLPPCQIPRTLGEELRSNNINLRGYQIEGISWLRFLHSVNLNGALCDSMGLGKTVQVLVAIAMAHLDQNTPGKMSLIVCPASVVGHWVAEIQKFFPSGKTFQTLCYTGDSQHRKRLRGIGFQSHNILVTSYSVLRNDIAHLGAIEWIYCVLDEGHLLKNPKTATARASRNLKARHRVILTGTPVQNNVSEVWAVFDFLMPNYLGSSSVFSKKFVRPIMRSQLSTATPTVIQEGSDKLKVLHQQTLPFILRREKEQVLRELPPKVVTVLRVPLSPFQQRLYKEFCDKTNTQQSLKEFKEKVRGKELDESSLGEHVLKVILFLRLLSTHPALVLEHGSKRTALPAGSGKFDAIVSIFSEAGIHNDDFHAADSDSSALYIDIGEDHSQVPEESLDLQHDFVDQAATCNKARKKKTKCLIFSQFTRTLDILERDLLLRRMPHLKYLRIDGSVPSEQRATIAETFNRDPNISVMLLTTRVGSLGLNLTGANLVIILESDFNPFVDLQAMDRAHRIGQNDTVNVYRIVAEDSIEEVILQIQDRKVQTSNAIVNSENSSMYQMGTERLLDIFSTGNPANDAGGEVDEIDLDVLLASYADDYASLSATAFSASIQK